MLRNMSRESGFTKIEVIFIVVLILVIAGIAVPGLVSSQRASNERERVTNLRILVSAEADFRANDRDGNGVNDFWTADVKGLHTMTSAPWIHRSEH
jgi:type II secretory pathway pseudopilin PulG